MPVIELHLIEGYAPEVKTRLGKALTAAVRMVLPAAPDAVTVITHEAPRENYMRGGSHRSGAAPLPDPVTLVQDFLAAMEARDLERARGFLAVGFTMQFPAAPVMTRLEELVAWAAPRYRRVTKTYERFDTCPGEAGPVVYCFGTLAGAWPDGTPFGGIRFIDRFETGPDGLRRQDVWNDIGETLRQPS